MQKVKLCVPTRSSPSHYIKDRYFVPSAGAHPAARNVPRILRERAVWRAQRSNEENLVRLNSTLPLLVTKNVRFACVQA